jgi:hypothetical protein
MQLLSTQHYPKAMLDTVLVAFAIPVVNVDVLYHEAMFCPRRALAKTSNTQLLLKPQIIALKANVKQLI